MKRLFTVLLIISMFGIWSCKRENWKTDPNENGETFPVDFAVNPSMDPLAATVTKTDINLPEGTTVRVMVYKRANTAPVPDPTTDTYVAENTYKILNDGSFEPCKTDASGAIVSSKGTVMELRRGDYDFYAYAPAIEMSAAARPALQVVQGIDHLGIPAVMATVTGKRINVNLGAFKHKGSQLHFTVTRKADAATVHEVALQDAGVKVEKLTASPATYTLGGDINASGVAYDGSSDIPGGWFVRTNDYTLAALDTILPRVANTLPADDLKLTFNVLVNGSYYKTYTKTISGLTFQPGNRYLFNVLVKDGGATLTMFELLPWTNNVMSDLEVGGDPSNGIVVADWSEESWETGMGDGGVTPSLPVAPANCYMMASGELMTFNAKIQGNGAAGAATMNPVSLGILWQTGDGVNPLIKSVTLGANGQATVLTNSAVTGGGNAVVAAYSGPNCTGTILWSWHIWVTDYQPSDAGFATRAQNSAIVVDGGQVHTYGTQFQKANGTSRVIMDRNLGATAAAYAPPADVTAAAKTFGFFYQWGRKDPFPGSDGVNATTPATQPLYAADGKTVVTTTAYRNVAGPVSVATAVANPGNFYTTTASPYDWNSTPNNTLWGNGAAKSIYDPCPEGWRIAPNGTWSDFGTNPYAAPFFYYINGVKQTASGTPAFVQSGRNGRLYEAGSMKAWYPTPGYRGYGEGAMWGVGHSGYSWSSAVSGIHGMYLYFSSGGLDPIRRDNRAHGFQVRCVQE